MNIEKVNSIVNSKDTACLHCFVSLRMSDQNSMLLILQTFY